MLILISRVWRLWSWCHRTKTFLTSGSQSQQPRTSSQQAAKVRVKFTPLSFPQAELYFYQALCNLPQKFIKKNHRNNTTISLFRNSKGLGYWKSQMCIYKEGADWSSPGQWRGRTKHHSGTLQQGFGECGCGHLRQ